MTAELVRLKQENDSLRKTVAVLTERVEAVFSSPSNLHDTFTQSILLQQIVERRTTELEKITQSVRTEAEYRRKAEESMRQERRLLQSVLSHIPYLVSWKDKSCVFQGCNAPFAQSIGIASSNDVVGLTNADVLLLSKSHSSRDDIEQRVIETGIAEVDFEEQSSNSESQCTTLLTSIVPMRDENGDITGTLTISADITERKRLENQLVQAQKLESIGQLAAGIAHEINTPAQYVGDNIRFIQGEFSNLLDVIDKYAAQLDRSGNSRSWEDRSNDIRQTLEELDYEFLREEIPNALDQSIEGVSRIAHIVRAMKDFSHPGSASKVPSDLNKAIESTTTVCSNRWKYVADLALELDPNLPPVPCLLSEFNQVMLNLIVNAADAIETNRQHELEKGSITIRSKLDGGSAVIEVTDTGGGMPEEVQCRIFDPFFTTKKVGKGTGQGLAISRDVIVEKHGGQLECRVQPKIGTTFCIRLPLTSSHKDAA
ncbi:MAG: PAS domain-containing protein [Phycisphaeraceae bacterium]|nr:PAS domain-containing protein [Phycisphaerales bacterium]MCB9858830.1 PAS domain-containing protein [Phycisphaeraceae bacterium]